MDGKHSKGKLTSWVIKLARGMEKSVVGSGTVFANLTSLGITIMILMGTLDVIGTKLFNTPLPTTYEATESLMLVITFGGLAFVQHQKRNITVDLLVRHFSLKAKIVSELVGHILGFLLFALFTIRSASYFWESFKLREHAEALVPFPIYPTKFIMFLGAGLVTIQLSIDIFYSLRRLWDKSITSAKASR
jgi:TRAP-type C4-dicarboxylate transport system permease small subunit